MREFMRAASQGRRPFCFAIPGVEAATSPGVDQVRTALAYAAHVAAHLPPAVRQVS